MSAPSAPSALRSRRVLTPEGIRPAALHLADGRITRVAAWDDLREAAQVRDAGPSLVMPGLIDTHVHVNEPGRTEWEGFATATRAAAAGGITTICDMPLNSIPATTSVAALHCKRKAAHRQAGVNVEFIGGVVPGNGSELAGLAGAGVVAFKCFLAPSGVPEFPAVSEAELREAFALLAPLGRPLLVHAEDPAWLRQPAAGGCYRDYLDSRPVAAEREAIAMLIRLMQECPSPPVHVVHLSSAASLTLVREARARGLPLTVETCPHYLSFAAEEIPGGATQYKCAPPIRSAAERDALWEALLRGDIDLVASDHSPCPPDLKGDGDFAAAWGGIASLELSLAAVWTGARARGAGPERIAEWMSAGPARLVGLADRKGLVAPGFDADLVVWDPDRSFVVDPARLHQRHQLTPYAGRELWGTVRAVLVGGRIVAGGL